MRFGYFHGVGTGFENVLFLTRVTDPPADFDFLFDDDGQPLVQYL
jgi:hypothetical protein